MSAHDARDLREGLTRQLVQDAALTTPEWREAFAAVPRETFVPRFFVREQGGGMRAVDATDDDWLTTVYADRSLITQLDGDDHLWEKARRNGGITGRSTSSSTQPTLMAWMLEALDIDDAHTVLEVGTGTGYNAALLTQRLGARQVTTIDIDPDVVQHARKQLAQLGYYPLVAAADAEHGYPNAAPYDRIMATCSWPRIPSAWLTQTRPGARILSHLHTDLNAGALAKLTVHQDGSASGHFLPQYGAFMPPRRYQAPDTLAMLERALRSGEDGTRSHSSMPAGALTSEGFSLFAALRSDGIGMHWFQPDDAPAMRTWLLSADGSWAYQQLKDDELIAVQGGTRHLWTELEQLYRQWIELGHPARERFGLTVETDGTHTVWLDSAHHRPRWNLSESRTVT